MAEYRLLKNGPTAENVDDSSFTCVKHYSVRITIASTPSMQAWRSAAQAAARPFAAVFETASAAEIYEPTWRGAAATPVVVSTSYVDGSLRHKKPLAAVGGPFFNLNLDPLS